MYLIFDTETTGLPKDYQAPLTDFENWPRLVQIAWQLHDKTGKLLSAQNLIVRPDGFTIPFNAEKVHGISTERALAEGWPLSDVLQRFNDDLARTQRLIAHNIEFDMAIVGCEFLRQQTKTPFHDIEQFCTKTETTDFVALPGGKGGKYKWPTLTELHQKLFNEPVQDAHDAAYDVAATARCFFGLLTQRVVPPKDQTPPEGITYEAPKLKAANFAKATKKEKFNFEKAKQRTVENSLPFQHLHVHTQFSVLQSTIQIADLIATTKAQGMTSVTMTDLGNLFGAFQFVRAALKADLKPIVGCEFYLTADRHKQKFTKHDPERLHQQVLIAKHKAGYRNLCQLSSLAYTEGMYAGNARIDKALLMTYKEGLIALTGGLEGEIPSLILNVGEKAAEEAFLWWKAQFGQDFYAELQRHGLPEEDRVNETLLKFCRKHQVKYVATNNVYYAQRKDADAHDILLCVKQGEKQSTPKDFFLRGRSRSKRFGFPNDEFYLKSGQEMNAIFYDLPEAIATTNEITDKIEAYKLQRDVLLPKFDIPEGFEGENEYLRHLTYEGAKKRYPEITPEIQERIDFELATIKNTGYPGYFLIVQDFTSQARKMGVSVGPGRGSAAGSVVAYCTGITNVDPIKYDLLFERFLNPDRISLPDIDIDFDDRGRDQIIQWVVQKYGYNQVAQIITYGTMAAKSSIRDTARVLDLPLSDSDRLAKLVPDTLKLNKLFGMDKKDLAQKLKSDQVPQAQRLLEIAEGTDLEAETINKARVLEGSLRNTGIHACGVIITPSDIRQHVPVATAKDADLLVTQFDNSVVEDAGMLKMDFLGLKTLTIIKDAITMIRENHGAEINEDDIPLDDPKTYEFYQKGLTNGTFQFESPGMQKHLRALKPDKFEDLIAMNALYRPGPLEYIPNFIARKHGREAITYDIDDMSEYLSNTYGITVYQEQVMLLSQKLAGFTKGEADALRKGMGKKKKEIIDQLKPKFMEGCQKNGYDLKKVEKVWTDWEAFAAYAFNKSHSTCYSVIAFHTMYLKAHYTAEYMASVLTHNMNDLSKITFFIEECKALNVPVLGPDINESMTTFRANKKKEIRFGLGAIKGAGEAAVQAIIDERQQNGYFADVFDFVERINLRTVNKKTFESLILSGAFDNCGTVHRAQYFHKPQGSDLHNFELVLKYGAKRQQEKDSAQVSIFGGGSGLDEPRPKLESCPPWPEVVKLNKEKEVVGFFISGHPLDQYRLLISQQTNADLSNWQERKNKTLTIAGIITDAQHRMSKKGTKFAIVTIEDYKGSEELAFFGQDYLKNNHLLQTGEFVLVTGKVEERYNSPGQWQIRPNEVQLLADLKTKDVSRLKLSLSAEQISEEIISLLEELIQTYIGDCRLEVSIQDAQQRRLPPLVSSYKIRPTPQLLQRLDALQLNYEMA